MRFKITAIIDNPAGDWLYKNDIRLCVKMTNAGDFGQTPGSNSELTASGNMRVDTVVFYGTVAEGKFVATRTLAEDTPVNQWIVASSWPIIYPRTYVNWDPDAKFAMNEDQSDVRILQSYFDPATKTAFVEYVRPHEPTHQKNVVLEPYTDYEINVSWGRFDDIFDGVYVGSQAVDELDQVKATRGKSETTNSTEEWQTLLSPRPRINSSLRNVPGYRIFSVYEPIEGKASLLTVSALLLLTISNVI